MSSNSSPLYRTWNTSPLWRTPAAKMLCVSLALAGLSSLAWAQAGGAKQVQDLNQMSLEQLASVEITTVTKDPQSVLKTPAAVYVITQEDIRRSGATSLPEALRLAPGVEVARIDADHWSVAVRGFAGQFS